MRISSGFLFLTAGALIFAPGPASAIGVLVCETPAATAITNSTATLPMADDAQISFAKAFGNSSTLLTPVTGEKNNALAKYCAYGPIVNTSPKSQRNAPAEPSYLDYRLSRGAPSSGFRFQLATTQRGVQPGSQLTLLALDFTGKAGASVSYRVAVHGTARGADLVLLSALGDGVEEVGRLALGTGPIALSWADGVVSLVHADQGLGEALPLGSQAASLRLGSLGFDPPQRAQAELYALNPGLVAE